MRLLITVEIRDLEKLQMMDKVPDRLLTTKIFPLEIGYANKERISPLETSEMGSLISLDST